MVWKVIKRCGEGFPSGNLGRCSRQVVWGQGKVPWGMMLAPRPVIIPLIEYLKHKGRPGLELSRNTILYGLQSGHLLKRVPKFRRHCDASGKRVGKNTEGLGWRRQGQWDFFFFFVLYESVKTWKNFPERTLGKLGWKHIHPACPAIWYNS